MPLLFGLPVAEAVHAADEGELALGGCLLPDDAPNWQCADGRRWRNPDEQAWDARLREVLRAHGYREDDEDATA
ncbi:hypothetical protein [Micromonospora avicenniae]|uniref:hypothetical protein n=1 Tax=Micromonospora avicenniae TaxID=1198245 RepID=UPI0033287A32